MVLLLLAVACLAASGIFVRLSELGPITTAAYRILLAMPLAFIWYKIESREEHRAIGIRDMALLQTGGVFLGIDLTLWHISLHLTTIANANLLANLMPFTVIPLLFFFYREKISKGFWLALLIVISGLIMLVSGKTEIMASNLKGDMLAIIASLFYGLYFITVYHLRKIRSYGTGYIMFFSGFGSLLIFVPCALIFETGYYPVTIEGIVVLVLLAVVSHIFGLGLLAASLKEVKASLSSVLLLSQPVIAAGFAYLIFNEKLTLTESLGVIVVTLGIYLAKRNS